MDGTELAKANQTRVPIQPIKLIAKNNSHIITIFSFIFKRPWLWLDIRISYGTCRLTRFKFTSPMKNINMQILMT